MKTDIWMPIYIGDYLKGTMRLSTEEHGAYFLLLMELWTHDGKIIPDMKSCARICRMDIQSFKVVWESIEPLFDYDAIDGLIYHPRLLKELRESVDRRVQAQENGKKGGRPRKPRNNLEVNPTLNPEKTSSPSPYTNDNFSVNGKNYKEFWE